MRILHIAPGDSAGGSLQQAINEAGRDDEVLRWLDDLSCGPVSPDDFRTRAEWWSRFHPNRDFEGFIKVFWDKVTETDYRLVVWFARHAASEFAFFLAWADRLGDRSYDIVDVTGYQYPVVRRDGSTCLSEPASRVGTIATSELKKLLGTEQPITAERKLEAQQNWQRLRAENAPFRIVTPAGLVSAPVDCFDSLLLAQATREWRRLTSVINETIGLNSDPYHQVGDVMLLMRASALVDQGRLIADGDPRDMFSCQVRLPD
jgi:hypothetical protein